ncbi:MAG TPA: ABC transporter permease [Spirochaetales bacterium]|nr:ABC transporter permease [Spirochaetales bacterium]HPG85501.1 ABC transporter permease [Spirochaetales bacterium]HPM73241.1 ABC transporter permease [Spirochaetales bacterium]
MIKDFFKTLVSNTKSLVGLCLLGFFVLVAILAPVIAPYPPKLDRLETVVELGEPSLEEEILSEDYPSDARDVIVYRSTLTREYEKTVDYFPLRAKPSAAHPLGTNHAGNDLFSQLVWGTRVSLTIGLLTGLFVTVLSLTLALLSGYLGGVADDVITFVTNVMLVIPGLPLMIVVAAYVTMKGTLPIVLILGLTGWPYPTRLLRSQVLTLKNRDFVRVSKSLGERTSFVVFREILPNMISIAMAEFFATSMAAILGEATLEFIGLGNVTVVSWGTILFWAQANGALLSGAWWWFLPPGICIALVGTSFVLINFAIDEISNPRLRKR